MKLFIFIGMTVVGWFGWWLGAKMSSDITIPFLLSSVGTIAGVVLGWWVARRLEIE